MRYRRFPRFEWDISEIGYGMWGMGGWTGSDDAESAASLDVAVSLGCNFFDTALAYGEGKSERLLGEPVRVPRHTGKMERDGQLHPNRLSDGQNAVWREVSGGPA